MLILICVHSMSVYNLFSFFSRYIKCVYTLLRFCVSSFLFIPFSCMWMCSISEMSLLFKLFSLSLILKSLKLKLWLFLLLCSWITLFIDFLCSSMRVDTLLFVWPTYVASQSLQWSLYTTFFSDYFSFLSFPLIITLHMRLCIFGTVVMLWCFKECCIFS